MCAWNWIFTNPAGRLCVTVGLFGNWIISSIHILCYSIFILCYFGNFICFIILLVVIIETVASWNVSFQTFIHFLACVHIFKTGGFGFFLHCYFLNTIMIMLYYFVITPFHLIIIYTHFYVNVCMHSVYNIYVP